MCFDKKIVVCIVAIDNFFEKQVVQLLHYRSEPKADAETSNLAATAIPKYSSVLALSDATVHRRVYICECLTPFFVAVNVDIALYLPRRLNDFMTEESAGARGI